MSTFALTPSASSPSSTAAPSTLTAAPPSIAELSAWRQDIATKLSASASPELLARAHQQQALRERAARAATHAKKGARLEKCTKMSRAAIAGSMMSYGSASAAPPPPSAEFSAAVREEAAPRLFSGRGRLFGASAAAPPPRSAPAAMAAAMATAQQQQQQVLFGAVAAPRQSKAAAAASAARSSAALASLQKSALADDDEEGEAALEEAQAALCSAGHAWAGAGGGGLDAVDDALGDGDALVVLLRELRSEPSDSAEIAAKFALYEAHAETVATVRAALWGLWGEAAAEFDGADAGGGESARGAVEKKLRAIDDHANLELREDRGAWFVYAMARKVSANEAAISTVMRDVQATLERLARPPDELECPICLEPLQQRAVAAAAPAAAADAAAPVTLSCAHRVCADCWRHWSAVNRVGGRTPFCPLCRQEEFLGVVLAEAPGGGGGV